MSGRLARAIRLSPAAIVRRVTDGVTQALSDGASRRRDAAEPTYSGAVPSALNTFLSGITRPAAAEHSSRAADLFCAHRFDLLGSGWVNVQPGMQCEGLEGIIFPPSAHDTTVNLSNRAESDAIRSLIPRDYQPIDWHIDFRSGYRWNPQTWYRDIRFGSVRGADVKLPWELSRLQHLPQLAIEFGRTSEPRYSDEVRNQILDWIASNPPRYGVNWYSTMDVAIRAANMLVAYDLLHAYGSSFNDSVESIFRQSIHQHAVHIAENLEWSETLRANHYLANIAGLAFCAAYLPASGETDSWLEFAAAELETAIEEQFHEDGSNFEASTCYHRLSAEMVVYAVAILRRESARLPEGRQFSPAALARIAAMREFTRGVTKPNGLVWQVGDNDSGRFLKFSPAYAAGENGLRENPLDHAHLGFAIGALFGETSHLHADAAIIGALIGSPFSSSFSTAPSNSFKKLSPSPISNVPPADRREIKLELSASVDWSNRYCFPDFGLFIYRDSGRFLGIRCGSVGQNGIGGHAHNDQLSLEIHDDGRDLRADPGTFVYTPLPEMRNKYRAGAAHFAPREAGRDQANLGEGLFRLDEAWSARCIEFLPNRFIGEISREEKVIRRTVTFAPGQIIVTDESWGCMLERDNDGLRVAFSPGYGIRSAISSQPS